MSELVSSTDPFHVLRMLNKERQRDRKLKKDRVEITAKSWGFALDQAKSFAGNSPD